MIGQLKTEKLFEWFDTHVSMFGSLELHPSADAFFTNI